MQDAPSGTKKRGRRVCAICGTHLPAGSPAMSLQRGYTRDTLIVCWLCDTCGPSVERAIRAMAVVT